MEHGWGLLQTNQPLLPSAPFDYTMSWMPWPTPSLPLTDDSGGLTNAFRWEAVLQPAVYGFYSPGSLTQDDDTYLVRSRSLPASVWWRRAMIMSWRMLLYKLSITAWYTPPTMTLRASCMTHGRIRTSMTFSAVYNERRASGHRCFWMRWIEPADCRLERLLPGCSWEGTAHALTTLYFRTFVSAVASSRAYTAPLPACTASFVLAAPCIKKPGHVSVHGDGGCAGLSCGPLVNICMLSRRELRPASMMPLATIAAQLTAQRRARCLP